MQMLPYPKVHLTIPTVVQTAAPVIALLLICVPFTIGAIGAFPIYDDAWFWLLLREHGVNGIVPALRDRPVWAALLALLASSERVLWFAAFAAQALLWPVLGLLAALLWKRLFPYYGRFAFTVACVTIAPFATKVQMLTVQFAIGPLLSTVLAYTAVLLLFRFVTAADRVGKLAFAISFPVLAAGVILTEYALSVVTAAAILFVWRLWIAPDPAETYRQRIALLVLIVGASATYVAFLLLTDRSHRPNVHPLSIFASGYSLLGIPVRLSASLWYGTVGGFATAVNEVTWISLQGILGAGYGALVAVLLGYSSLNGRGGCAVEHQSMQRDLLPLAVALVVGIVPVAVAGRTWGGGMESRFGVPMLPLLAALLVLGTLVLVRPRFWVVPVLVFGFVAANTVFTETWTAIRERKMMDSIGEVLQLVVSEDEQHTVAVLALPERALGWQRPWELTARLTADWMPNQRAHFWAYVASDKRVVDSFGQRGYCKYPLEIDAHIKMGPTLDRLVARSGPVGQLLWVVPQADGSVVVEKYCSTVYVIDTSKLLQ